jgi:hypothetical protein
LISHKKEKKKDKMKLGWIIGPPKARKMAQEASSMQNKIK